MVGTEMLSRLLRFFNFLLLLTFTDLISCIPASRLINTFIFDFKLLEPELRFAQKRQENAITFLTPR